MKLRSVLLFPFLQNISPKLLPKRGLKHIENTLWESTDYDPQFLLKGALLKFLSGWITVEVHIESENEISPKLYLDFGEGYTESRVVYMMPVDEGFFRAELMLPKVPVGIRFDPTDDIALFSITECRIKIHSEVIHLFYQFVSIIKNDMKKGEDPLRILKKSHVRYKKHGYIGMLERLEKEYRLVHPEGIFQSVRSKKSIKKYQYKMPKYTLTVKNEIENFQKKPLVSIIMPVYNVKPQWLQCAIDSLTKQWYGYWELCIVDDASSHKKTVKFLKEIEDPKIKIKFLTQNSGISKASNEALSFAEGEYVVLMDHDDELAPDALYEFVREINRSKAEFIYSDEDFIDLDNTYVSPHFKPDYSPELLLSHNYITHLACIKKSLLDEIDQFDPLKDTAQDYDLFLKIVERTERIVHIPKVLYHWRMHPESTSMNSQSKPKSLEAGKKALEDALCRRGKKGSVHFGNLPNYFKINYTLLGTPLISIVIPFKDKPELLKVCIESILQKSTYKNFEIIAVSNNSEENETFLEIERLKKKDERIRFYEHNIPFNYSEINNYAIENFVEGEYIVLMNNDIEIITPEWMEELLMYSQQEGVGAVGAKLYYGNDTIQHAGIIIGLGGYAAHSHRTFKRNDFGYFNRLNVVQNISGVTGALLMVKKCIYQEVNGMDEENFEVAYNDVDLCLKILKRGYRNIFTPYCEAYHYESMSRGDDSLSEKTIERFDSEKEALLRIHGDFIEKGDPYYNKNLTLSREDFSLKEIDKV